MGLSEHPEQYNVELRIHDRSSRAYSICQWNGGNRDDGLLNSACAKIRCCFVGSTV